MLLTCKIERVDEAQGVVICVWSDDKGNEKPTAYDLVRYQNGRLMRMTDPADFEAAILDSPPHHHFERLYAMEETRTLDLAPLAARAGETVTVDVEAVRAKRAAAAARTIVTVTDAPQVV